MKATYIEVAEVLKTIGHPRRIAIILLLSEFPKLKVKQIAKKLQINPSVVSQHLRLLKNENVVVSRPRAKTRLYSLTNQIFAKIVADLLEVLKEESHGSNR